MKAFWSFILLILLPLSAFAAESDSLYATAMKMVQHERETEARLLLERCLELERPTSKSKYSIRNIEHWISYLRNRALDHDTAYNANYNFTPIDRRLLKDYIPVRDFCSTLPLPDRASVALRDLEKIYYKAVRDVKLNDGYRLDILLQIDAIERFASLERSALPRLCGYATEKTSATEHGLELINALYGGYGTDIFDHISHEVFSKVGSDAVFLDLWAGRAQNAIN